MWVTPLLSHSVTRSVTQPLTTSERKLENSLSFQYIFIKLVHMLPRTFLTDWLKWNVNFLFVCPSIGSFVHWKMEKWDNLLNFEDIFTKIWGHLVNDISQGLAKINFFFDVCLSAGLFKCWLKKIISGNVVVPWSYF